MMMLWAAVLLLSLGLAGGDSPATQPQSQVKQWLTDLASDEATARDAARKAMLGMTRPQLLELRRLVADGEARLPAQRAALAEIVRHVYLATEPYAPAPGETRSFIGLSRWRLVEVGDYTGVAFERRLPGFDAYRALEDGDVILKVEEMPDLRLEGNSPLEAIRRNFRPGSIVHLIVLRDDRIVRADLKLSPTPLWHVAQGLEELSQREITADQYWNREFAPLLEAGPS